jgi:cyanophycinase
MILSESRKSCLTITLRLPYDRQSFDKISGMIALVGSGEYLTPMESVDRYLLQHLPGQPRVVCLPTAAGTEGADRIRYWFDLGIQHFTRLGVAVESLNLVDRTSANDPELVERIRQANFVYLSGGKPNYLLNTMSGSLAWQAIQEVIASGGLLVGCSAGAMILGERIAGFAGAQTAFNLVHGSVIIPHYDEIAPGLIKIFKHFVDKKLTLIGVEGNTALFIANQKTEVVGMGGVTIWNQRGNQRFLGGQSIDLPSLLAS